MFHVFFYLHVLTLTWRTLFFNFKEKTGTASTMRHKNASSYSKLNSQFDELSPILPKQQEVASNFQKVNSVWKTNIYVIRQVSVKKQTLDLY